MTSARKLIKKVHREFKNVKREASWKFAGGESQIINATGGRLLVYHGVCSENPFRYNTLFITAKTFEEHLQYYKRYFEIVSLDDFYKGNFSSKKFRICLSFDDGFANNYNYVLPLLEKYQVPASFFITSIRSTGTDILWNDFLSLAYKYGPVEFEFEGKKFTKGPDNRYRGIPDHILLSDWLRAKDYETKKKWMRSIDPEEKIKKRADQEYWLQMTKEEIKKLSQNKWVTIGSHSSYHDDLASMPVPELITDLGHSKKFLEEITGKEIRSIAFPYGSYSKTVLQESANAGYTQLLATDLHAPDDKENALIRERLTINPFISTINQMHANISGSYD